MLHNLTALVSPRQRVPSCKGCKICKFNSACHVLPIEHLIHDRILELKLPNQRTGQVLESRVRD